MGGEHYEDTGNELEDYFAQLGSELSEYESFLGDTDTFEDLASRYEGGKALLEAAHATEDILTEPATVTVGYASAARAAGTEDQYLTIEDEEVPELRFEDDLDTLQDKARASWVFSASKSPTNVKTRNVRFQAYFDVPEEDAKPIQAEDLDKVELQLPSLSRMRSLNGRERYAIQSRLEAAERMTRDPSISYGDDELTQEFELFDDFIELTDPDTSLHERTDSIDDQ